MSVEQQNAALAAAFESFRAEAEQVGGLLGAHAEESLYGPVEHFLTAAATALGHSDLLVVHQVGTGGLLTPDYGVFRTEDLVGWVELKAPAKNLDSLTGADARQFERATSEMQLFIQTNGWQWRLYEDGSRRRELEFPIESLTDPAVDVSAETRRQLAEFLGEFFDHTAALLTSPEDAARLMARRARALHDEVLSTMREHNQLLDELYAEFETLVYASGRTYSHNDFADAYAQTAIFGLLLSRLASGNDLTYGTAADGIDPQHHPFLWRCLSLFTDQTLPSDLQVVVREAITSINRVPPGLFRRHGAIDPLLYAYETFFAAYDAEERAARGVFYTPPAVVEHQIAAVEAMLQHMGVEHLLSSNVTLLDPATGTGTYLLALLERAFRVAEERGMPADAEIAAMVSERLRAFELMIGPYTVAHQRVSTFLIDNGVHIDGRLPVFLVDTLAETVGGDLQSRFGALGQQLTDERQQAEFVKSEEPVLVVIGNPPYDRIRRDQLGDHWLLERIEDIKQRTPASDRINLKALYDFYVAFWRWALWLIAERDLPGTPKQGVIAYITNRSWIIGRGFGGLRSLISEWCSDVWVLDLGGDYRAGRLTDHDQNVFDIRVGVAIVLARVDIGSDAELTVRYRRLWGRRTEKEAALHEPFDLERFEIVTRELPTDPFIPIEWGPLSHSPAIESFFSQHETGVQTSRDSLLVGLTANDVLRASGGTLGGTVGDWSRLPEDEKEAAFNTTRTHPTVPGGPPDPRFLKEYAYRPLDYRVIYNDPNFVEWPRPGLQRSFARPNLALVTIERGFGAGPAAFPVTALPDLHVFRGRGSRGIYPLYGRGGARQRGGQIALAAQDWTVNLAPAVMEWAGDVGLDSPEAVFAYASALLGAPSYTTLFEGGLVAERPRIPLTIDVDLALEAAGAGAEWVDLWALAVEPPAHIIWEPGGQTGAVFGPSEWSNGVLSVANRRLHGVTEAMWEFEVSGYPVLQRYLREREEAGATAVALDQLRRVVAALDGIVGLGPTLDELLDQVISSPQR